MSALRICAKALWLLWKIHANSLTPHGEHVLEDKELTPTLENFVVLTWLRQATLRHGVDISHPRLH